MSSKDDWTKVREALNDLRWDFRAVEAIARQAGLSRKCVEEAFKSRRSD